MKLNKKVLEVLEQYYSSLNQVRPESDPALNVPNTPDDREYKTSIAFPPMAMEDIEEPEIKTKKGKTVLREPPDPDPDENEVKSIRWESELEEIDNSELEEMINVIDEDFITEQPKEKTKSDSKKEKSSKQTLEGPPPTADPPEEDDNGMGDLAQTNMGEQNPASGKDANAQTGSETPDPTQMMGGQQDPNAMGGDPSGMGGMSGLGGVGGDQSIDPLTGQPKKTSQEVGRIFELKKIYSRLLSIESQLSFSSDIVLLKLRKFVSDAVELFETLISNVDAFKDEIDEIIVMYYNFLTEIYEILKKYYQKKQSEEKIEQNKKNAKSLP